MTLLAQALQVKETMIDPIIDRSTDQKAIRVDKLREELKPLGYSVVLTTYLAALAFQAKRLKRMEEA